MTELEILNHIENGDGIFERDKFPALDQIERELNLMLACDYIKRAHPAGREAILRRTDTNRVTGRVVRLDVLYGLTAAGKQRLLDLTAGSARKAKVSPK